MLLELDARTFTGNAQGVSLTLYRKPGQQVYE